MTSLFRARDESDGAGGGTKLNEFRGVLIIVIGVTCGFSEMGSKQVRALYWSWKAGKGIYPALVSDIATPSAHARAINRIRHG